MSTACIWGTHRVVSPAGVLPQAAERLDASLPIRDNECLIDVETLNIDAASFRQMDEAASGDPDRIAACIVETVRARGKQHNPVTGSGGMLLGRVRQIGTAFPETAQLSVGDEVATLVSLSLTPLHLEKVRAVHRDLAQVDVRGHAILFASGVAAVLPADLPRRTALAVLDVAGAPIQTARLVEPGMTVLVVGMGKSGALCMAQAHRSLGGTGRLIGLDRGEAALAPVRELGLADELLVADATDALAVYRQVEQATFGRLCDLVINTANVPRTEMGCILSARQGGRVYFFNTAISFTAAALGAEGVARDVQLLIGNGYAHEHAKHALELVRRDTKLWHFLEQRTATPAGQPK